MLRALTALANHGRLVLVAGLVAGLTLPGLAQMLKPWLRELVLLLLFLTAFRIGLPATRAGLRQPGRALALVLAYQIALPLGCLAFFTLLGLGQTPAALILTLLFAAPSVTGCPNMAVLLGHRPEPAFRLLITGTLLLPLTIIPVFWLSPALGDLPTALATALELALSIGIVIACAFALRQLTLPDMTAEQTRATDGLTSLALAVIVVGLMSALAPALHTEPARLVRWLALAFAANLGMQLLAWLVLRRTGPPGDAVPMALVAGNRNVALFLVATSASQFDGFLIFLGCYQFPMYLTPILMAPFFSHRG